MSSERIFPTHEFREQIELDGIWEFQTIEEGVLPENYSDSIAVPSCWEMVISYCRYRGMAAYRKKITVDRTRNIRLLFKGISHTGMIYLDGKYVGKHYNAYTPFSIVIPNVEKGEHILEVIVDNQWTEESRLHIPNDYYTYGGITRSAYMELVPDCFIERTEFEPYIENGKWLARVSVFVRNISDKEENLQVKINCAGQSKLVEAVVFPGLDTEVRTVMEYEGISPWSQVNPKLYLLKTVLLVDNVETDDLIDRVGFRIVEQKEGKILLNGEPIFLKGLNRHEDHGIFGCAIPLTAMDADIKLFEELGANAVRTCHYPNDEKFLDLCDEHGIYVWEESHDRGGDVARLTHPLFMEQSMAVMHEMLEYHYNHPSIIIWGCLNEAASNEAEGAKIYKEHMDYLAKDKSRLNTYASNKHVDDICLGMESICSFNMYPYWYGDDTVEDDMRKIRDCMKNNECPDKPIIISEYGGGGIYNFHDVMHVKWSEEYQADLIMKATEEIFKQEDVVGIFVWQYCDTRISQEGHRNWPMTRPLSRNNKGVVDEYRRPKMAFYALKEAFSKK